MFQLGEDALSQGHVTTGVKHSCIADAVCTQLNRLLQVLRQTLPPRVCHMSVQK